MTGRTLTSTYSAGYYLANPAYNPLQITNTANIGTTGSVAFSAAAGQIWSVTNAGRIGESNAVAGGIGISLPTGSVANTTTGVIFGYDFGASIAGAGSVTNSGYIGAWQSGTAGISMGPGFTNPVITSAGVLVGSGGVYNAPGGAITGTGPGVAIGGGGTLINDGIIGPAATTFGSYGVVLTAGGAVTNNAGGYIGGDSRGYDNVGVLMTGTGAESLVNHGFIAGVGHAAIALYAQSGQAAYVGNLQGGLILANQNGVQIVNATGTVVNAGKIITYQPRTGSSFYYAGVELAQGGTVTNTAGGTISAKWVGVEIGTPGILAAGTIFNQGQILANSGTAGAAIWMHGPGLIDNAAGGTIGNGPFGIVAYAQTTLVNHGSIFGTQNAFLATSGGFADRVIVGQGATFSGVVNGGNAIGSSIVSTLELENDGSSGILNGFNSQFIDFGVVQVDAGALWSLGGGVVTQQTVAFNGTNAALTFTNPGSIAGVITGFGVTDTIGLGGITDVTGVTLTAGNVLSVHESSGPGLTLRLDPSQNLAGLTFHYAVSGAQTNITAVACFAAGTAIETESGPVAVEALQPGMAVRSCFGGTRPIVWIGQRTVDCRAHPAPRGVWPVRIAAGAFGPGLPARDLRLSPDHAVYVREVLIPVGLLVNGTSIRQVPDDVVTYYHIELSGHDVVLAEGLPAESYLDVGDRADFANNGGAVRLFPSFSRENLDLALVWEGRGCAPLVRHGPLLDLVRADIAARAADASLARRSAG